MTTTDVTPPPGSTPDIWEYNTAHPYRVVYGRPRGIDLENLPVGTTAIQFSDGTVDDGSVHEPPHVYLDDRSLTSAQARGLAALLLEAADEVDRGANR